MKDICYLWGQWARGRIGKDKEEEDGLVKERKLKGGRGRGGGGQRLANDDGEGTWSTGE